jgi:hypothetical protein
VTPVREKRRGKKIAMSPDELDEFWDFRKLAG